MPDAKIRWLADAKQAINETKKLSKTLEDMAKEAQGGMAGLKASTVTAWAAIAGAVLAAKKVFDFGRQGAEILELKDASQGLAASFGLSMDSIVAAVKRGASGTISEMDAIAAATRALNLGVVTSEEQFEQLAMVAETLGDRLGKSTAQSMDDVGQALTRLNSRTLASAGITADAESVFKAYAERLGKTVKELTNAEKRTALLDDATRRLGGQVPSIADNFDRFEASLKDTEARFKSTAAVMVDPFISGIADLSTAITGVAAEADKLPPVLERTMEIGQRGGPVMYAFGEAFEFFAGTAADVIANLPGVVGWFGDLLGIEKEVTPATEALTEVTQEQAAATDRHAAAEGQRAEALRRAKDEWLEMVGAPRQVDWTVNFQGAGIYDQIQDFLAGGGEVENIEAQITAGLDTGTLPPEVAQAIAGEALVWELVVDASQGEISARDAKARIAEVMNVTPEEAAALFGEAWNQFKEAGPAAVEAWATSAEGRITSASGYFRQALRVGIVDPLTTAGSKAKTIVDALMDAVSHPWRIEVIYDVSGQVPNFQHGGRLAPVSLVGEAGPELIIGSTVIPASETRRLMQMGVMAHRRLQGGGKIFYPESKGATTETQSLVQHLGGGRTRTPQAQTAQRPEGGGAQMAQQVAQETSQAAAAAIAVVGSEIAAVQAAASIQSERQIARQVAASERIVQVLQEVVEAVRSTGSADQQAAALAHELQTFQAPG
jgi:hypothetical protein